MILRRLAEGVRQQDWFTVVVEVLMGVDMRDHSLAGVVGATAAMVGTLLLTACMAGSYQAPISDRDTADFTKTVGRPFDEVWTDLIDHASATFFAIENIEKASGLITLSFGASNPGDYIDCGRIQASGLIASFGGPYVNYIVRSYRGQLNSRINIFVRSIDADTTAIRVNASYVFRGADERTGIDTWSFESGGHATIYVRAHIMGTNSARTCQPTYLAERIILDAME